MRTHKKQTCTLSAYAAGVTEATGAVVGLVTVGMRGLGAGLGEETEARNCGESANIFGYWSGRTMHEMARNAKNAK